MKCARELSEWPALDASNIHEFRLKVKQLRYILQLFADADSDFVGALGDVQREIDITSAHRSPARTSEYSRGLKARGVKVVIAGAGGAAHLAGVIAAETTLPVIAVPIPSTALLGLDSLLAMVQMPAGIPVATVDIGKPGATNAGVLAAQMIGLYDDAVAKKLEAHKEKLAKSVEVKSRKLKESQKG
jgi:phosphoribosylaminoimidazole carboxylase PurE protein